MKIYPAAGGDPVKDAGGAGEPSGGLYTGTTSEVPGNNNDPGTQDIATYTFTVRRVLMQSGAYADRFGRDHVDRFISDYLVVNQSNLQKYKEHQRKAKLAWSGVDSPGDL